MTAHVDAPQPFELALVPGDRLGEGDGISNPTTRMPAPPCRSKRELAGDTTSTDPRSRRIRESRKGRPCNELGLSAHCLSTACPHLRAPGTPCPGLAHHIAGSLPILLKNPLFWRQHLGFVAMSARQIPGSPPHVAKMGAGSGMSFASFRRFWAVAAKRNSSLAPLGPRRRNRPSLRMRFR
jgi:hypothetical protein